MALFGLLEGWEAWLIMPPKYMSGSQKRKRKLKIEEMIQSQAGDINKYFVSNKNIVAEVENTVDNAISREQDNELDENEIDTKKVFESVDVDVFNDHEKDEEFVQYENLNQETWYDHPAKWDNIDQKVRNFLVERGPNRDVINVFPKDNGNRHFNVSHYKRILTNREESDRIWLLYSVSCNKIFCFCCKLFKKQLTKTGYGQLANERYNDWHNLTRCLANHEASKEHMEFNLELDIDDIKGQGYDNGSNMKGVQKRFDQKRVKTKEMKEKSSLATPHQKYPEK
ncbi:uncharacterized protein LOC142514476 [Primulina tabacum]|uniref:uncharacterized protein LOC142514476 n=1 Tax=Primulina tabacum TaxID=48773 RepID=UPI003F5A74AF